MDLRVDSVQLGGSHVGALIPLSADCRRWICLKASYSHVGTRSGMTGTAAVGYILSMLMAWVFSQCRDPRMKLHRFLRKKSQSITSVMQVTKVSQESKRADERDERLASVYKEGREWW